MTLRKQSKVFVRAGATFARQVHDKVKKHFVLVCSTITTLSFTCCCLHNRPIKNILTRVISATAANINSLVGQQLQLIHLTQLLAPTRTEKEQEQRKKKVHLTERLLLLPSSSPNSEPEPIINARALIALVHGACDSVQVDDYRCKYGRRRRSTHPRPLARTMLLMLPLLHPHMCV